MQELTETLATLPKAVLVFTLPSSLLEHYDENAEKRFQQLQKVVGRMEKILTPVEDEEVAYVIRRRLFSHIDEKLAEEVIQGIY
jgi:predicted AAA+ superfamily ATPase